MIFITKFLNAVNALLKANNVGITVERIPGETPDFPICTINQTTQPVINFKAEPAQQLNQLQISFLVIDQSKDFSVAEALVEKIIKALNNQEKNLNQHIEDNKIIDCQIVSIVESYREVEKDVICEFNLNFQVMFE